MQRSIEECVVAGKPALAQWFALRTSSRHEKRVHARLLGLGVEAFLPLCERLSRWKDRRKKIDAPLFPGYCFARFDSSLRKGVVMTAGVVGIIGRAGIPEPVDEREIADLKRLVDSRLSYDPCPGLKPGMAVEVVRGPLDRVRGTLIRRENTYRLIISVNLIQQGAIVEIDADDVRPL